MSTKPQRLKKVIDDLRQIIVGQVAMPHDQIDQITLFIFIKQLSRMNDDLVRLGSKEIIFTGQYERYHYDVLSCLSGEELVKECRLAIESLYTNTAIEPTIRKLFERSYLKIMDSKVLGRFLAELTRSITDDMDMGDFYESLLPILGTQNELGQFRTPRHIIDFMVQMIDPKIGETICDPACGTAGFLISAFKFLCNKYSDEKGNLSLNPAQLKQLYTSTIFGWDIEPLMVKFSLANLYLHGLKNPNVAGNDTLLNENLWTGSDDIIIANPPFITPKGGAARHARFTNKSNKTEVLFLEWMIHHLNYNGRMGVIVPEGIIFDSSKGHTEIRKQMINSGLWCVVSLPANVFQPYSGVKTSILFLDKAMQCDKVLFCKIDNHGYSLNTNPSPIEKNDLPNVAKQAEAYKQAIMMQKEYDTPDKGVLLVEKAKLAESGDYNLNGERYLANNRTISKYPIVCLSEVAEVISGQSPEGTYYNSEGNGLPFYQGKTEFSEMHLGKPTKWTTQVTKKAIPNDIVMSVRAPVGPVNLVVNEICIGRGLAAIRCSEKLDYLYCFYVLRNMEEKITGNAGSTFASINRNDICNLKIPLPPLSVQKEIVAELDSYQKIIDGAKQVVDNWKPRIDIDPEWEMVKIGDVTSLVNGRAFTPDDWEKEESGGVPIIRIQNLNDDKSSFNYFTGQYDNKYLVEKGSLLFSWSGSRGTSFGPHIWKRERGILNQHIFLVHHDERYNRMFLYYALKNIVGEVEQKLHGGVGLVHITKGNFANIEIPIPDINIQKAIVDLIDNEHKLVDSNRQLIELYEQKIKDRIDHIWQSNLIK